MNTTDNVEKLTRLARRLPVKDIQMERTEGKHGEIYFAYGEGDNGTIHGMWACKDMVVHGVEIAPDTPREKIRLALIHLAEQEIDWFTKEGYWNGQEVH